MNRFALPAAIVAGLLASTISLVAQRAPVTPPTGVPRDILALACAPTVTHGPTASPLRVTGGQDAVSRIIYGPGDLIAINAGTANGIRVGQEFFVRRIQTDRNYEPTGVDVMTVHTAGWVRVYAVDDMMSLVTVTYACDAIQPGDYLEPFALPQRVVPSPNKPAAQRGNYARVLSGVDLRSTFGRGDFFTINRGLQDGIRPGAQFVVYRDKQEAGNFLFELGEAVAVKVGDGVSTLRVTESRDAFREGDYVAERK
jgi:hypothetical protein